MNKVINFHEINNLDWFEAAVLLLKSKYELVNADTLQEYFAGRKKLKNICHITVDDGSSTFHKFIFPILKKHQVPATIFVSPKIIKDRTNFWFQEIIGYDSETLLQVIADVLEIPVNGIKNYNCGSILLNLKIHKIETIIQRYRELTNTSPKQPQNMTMEQLLEIDRSGLVMIGAHTLNHPILANEDDATCDQEITGSIQQLADLLGRKINYFAYPNGTPEADFSGREKKYLITNGMQLAFSTESENFNLKNDIMSIPRFGVSPGSLKLIKVKLFMGSYWGKIKNLRSKSQLRERKELKHILETEK